MSIHPLMPEPLWRNFEILMRTPRPSYHCEQIVERIMAFGRSLNLPTKRDEAGNVLITKPATPGMEGRPIVCLQSHLDMVCEKAPDSTHDFNKDPLVPRIVVDEKSHDTLLMATGTTLGADDGIGVAMAMAVLEDHGAFRHGPLECLFTVDEEVGMGGARKITKDFGLRCKYLINLDSEEDWRVCAGCAGGFDVNMTLPINRLPIPHRVVGIRVGIHDGLSGHSGVEIHLGRLNALKGLARMICGISPHVPHILSFEGGNKRNVIPGSATAELLCYPEVAEEIKRGLHHHFNLIHKEYARIEPKLNVRIEDFVPAADAAPLTPECARRLLHIIQIAPHGVLRISPERADLVETSTNLFKVSTAGPLATVEFFPRSMSDSQSAAHDSYLRSLAELCGLGYSGPRNSYSGWLPDLESPLLHAAKDSFKAVHGKDPEIYAIHAGLECGILMGNLGEHLKCISIGPYLTDVHTFREALHLNGLDKFWQFYIHLLANIQ